jgi:cytochrome P450
MATLSLLLGGALAAFILAITPQYIRSYMRQSRLIRENGCQPSRKRKAIDPFFSLDVIWEGKKAVESNRLMALYSSFCSNYGTTHRTKRLHISGFMTIDPENIKTMLTTKFDDFDMSWRVKYAVGPLLGSAGMLTSNGSRWQHARGLAQPMFKSSQLKNTDALEVQFMIFLALQF